MKANNTFVNLINWAIFHVMPVLIYECVRPASYCLRWDAPYNLGAQFYPNTLWGMDGSIVIIILCLHNCVIFS